MTKKILNKKGLFNHYIHNQNQNELTNGEKTQEAYDSSIQKTNNLKDHIPKKATWKKVNIRMTEENYNAIKIHAILNNYKLEDLFDQIISDFINKKDPL